MNNRNAIFKSINTIEETIENNILIPELAKQYGFSSYYYSRLFKGITGFSPKSYITGRKLTLSTSDVILNEMKIIDIAFKYGFGSHEAYTRAFQKMFGLSPSEVRKNKTYPMDRGMKKLTPARIQQMDHLVKSTPELIVKDDIKLVGIPFYYDIQFNNNLSEPWGHLMSHLGVIKNKVEPQRFYQLQYWFPEQDTESIYFYIAVEVSDFEDIPIQLTEKVISKHKYLKFQHKGLANQVGYTYKYIYNEYLPETDYQLPYLFNFEYYGKQHLGPYNADSISDIYIPVSLDIK
ncbi:AraC family transcriptional regulator [Vallitalea sediminicola]